MLEKEIELPVVKWAQKHGFLTPKVKFQEAGWPDRLFISPHGHVIFIEFKRPGEKPDPLQDHRLAVLRSHGIPAFWVDDVNAGVHILQTALESQAVPAQSDKASVGASVRRLIPRPRPGKDVNRIGYVQSAEAEGLSEDDAVDRTPAADVHDVAGRDKEVD